MFKTVWKYLRLEFHTKDLVSLCLHVDQTEGSFCPQSVAPPYLFVRRFDCCSVWKNFNLVFLCLAGAAFHNKLVWAPLETCWQSNSIKTWCQHPSKHSPQLSEKRQLSKSIVSHVKSWPSCACRGLFTCKISQHEQSECCEKIPPDDGQPQVLCLCDTMGCDKRRPFCFCRITAKKRREVVHDRGGGGEK